MIDIDTLRLEDEGAEIEYTLNKITYTAEYSMIDSEGMIAVIDPDDDKITWITDAAIEKITYGLYA